MPRCTATGPDGIEVEFISNLSTTPTNRLLDLVSRSWREVTVPAAWRAVILSGIPKPSDPTALRPISLSSIVNHIAERLIGLRMTEWVETKLPSSQAGFRRFQNTHEHVAAMAQRTADAFSRRRKCAALFVDFSAAYDRVVIPALLVKTANFDCPPSMLCWMHSYLADRRAQGRLVSTVGRSRVLGCGLPKGSSLSPNLWNLYILDLDICLDDLVQFSFAEDTSFNATGRSWEDVISKLNMAAEILSIHRLRIKVNARKCMVLGFAADGRSPQETIDGYVSIGGEKIDSVTEYKFLGFNFDQRLSFKVHCREVTRKLRSKTRFIPALSGTSWGAETSTMEAFRKSYCELNATYGASAFAEHGFDSHIQQVEVARNDAARAASGCLKATAVAELRSPTGMRSLRDIGEIGATLVMEKALRIQPDAPVSRTAQSRELKSKRTGSWRDSSIYFLAEKGILALPRNGLPSSIQKDRSSDRFRTFTTLISAKNEPEEKRSTTEAFISERTAEQQAEIEIWRDGSVGEITQKYVWDLNHRERVSVKWDEGWYIATLKKFNPAQCENQELAKRFESRHGAPPDILRACLRNSPN